MTRVYLDAGRHLVLEQTLAGQKKFFMRFEMDKGVLPLVLFSKFLHLEGKAVRLRLSPRLEKREVSRMNTSILVRHVAAHPFPLSFRANPGHAPMNAHWVQIGAKHFLEFNAYGNRFRFSTDLAEKVVGAIQKVQTKPNRNFFTAEAVFRSAIRGKQFDSRGESQLEQVVMAPPAPKKESRVPAKRGYREYQGKMFEDPSENPWPRGKPVKKIDLSQIGKPSPPPSRKKQGELFPDANMPPRKRRKR